MRLKPVKQGAKQERLDGYSLKTKTICKRLKYTAAAQQANSAV